MNEEEKKNYRYLGDGVYAYFDGHGMWLRTGHHSDTECDHKIYLEPGVFKKLEQFVEDIKKDTWSIKLFENENTPPIPE